MTGLDLLVIQPTPFCNINCSYCYLPDRNNTHKISTDIIEHAIDALIIDKLLDSRLSIVWHAGEPLVLPPSFYRPLYQLFDKKLVPLGIEIQHCIQTNGTLISQSWCDYIKEYNIKIGISIDGPQHIHNTYRKTRKGEGTFQKVMEGISLLQANEIPYHAIAVISKASLEDPTSFFRFFYEKGFYNLGLNIEEVEGAHVNSTLFESDLEDKIRFFYKTLLDLYLKSDRRMGIREFDKSMSALLRDPSKLDIRQLEIDTHQNNPFSIISIDYQGNFSTFSPELIGQPQKTYHNFIFGNVLQHSFINSSERRLLDLLTSEIKQGIKKCRKECAYFPVCGGGSPANKFYENGRFDSTATNYCKYNIKLPSDIILTHLEEQLSR